MQLIVRREFLPAREVSQGAIGFSVCLFVGLSRDILVVMEV